MTPLAVPSVRCSATMKTSSSRIPSRTILFPSPRPQGVASKQQRLSKGTWCEAFPQKRRSVNFAEVEADKTDIFDLDKSINSALQWEKVRNFLTERGGVMSVTKAAADKLVTESGFTCIDVRTEKGFSEGTKVLNAICVPLFKGTDSASVDLKSMPRKVFFTLLPGVEGTFYNENFVDEVLTAVGSKDAPIVLSCARGGLIHKSKYYPKGIASRSFIAAAILIRAGFTNVAHVNGGTGARSKGNSMDRNILLEFIYGTELPAGTTSMPLMMVSYSLVLGYLAYLIIPKLPQATVDFATRAGWM